MSKKRKKSKAIFDRRTKVLIMKTTTVLVALIAVVVVSIYATGSKSKNQQAITITKEYRPSDEIANSIKMNENIQGAITSPNDAADTKLSSEAQVNSETIVSDSDTVINNNVDSSKSTGTNTTTTIDGSKEETPQVVQNEDKVVQNEDTVVEDDTLVDYEDTEIPNGLTEEEQIQYVKDKWVDNMIHENNSEIDQTDLSQGASIYNSLDTEYLFGLAKDGLTDQEKADAEAYLTSQLSQEQYELAMVLYNKYVGLVNK